MHHHHNNALVVLSIIIAIFASYTALDLVSSLKSSRGRAKWIWLLGGSLAMGVGIWSMHFIGMLAFRIHGVDIYYDVPLLLLSVLVAIIASSLALNIISHRAPSIGTYVTGSLVMGAAIVGMHYIGIASMRMAAQIHWDHFYVVLSIIIAIASSFAALLMAFKLRDDLTLSGFLYRGGAGILMGVAISGMHYTAMAAMSFTVDSSIAVSDQQLLATDGLAAAIIIGTLIILGIALSGSNIDRALSRKSLINDILKEGIEARDQFLSVASHELKTPLTAMKLQTELALRQLNNNEFDKDYIVSLLNRTNENFNRINRLVDDMLDISRITSGKLVLNKTKVNLGDIVLDAIERFKPLYTRAGAPDVKFQKIDIVGQFDVFRIEQVMNNILSNALKYGSGKEVEVTLQLLRNKALISVKDQGIGIAKEFQSKIFERFERAISASEVSGLGLGLFIVKEIVLTHGGKIWVESELGRGSVFKVEFPLE